jgi:tRNA modification GTPase
MDLLLARAIELGARTARPGEFSERAFLNDKLDLAQAEAIADLIDSGSSQAARAALRTLQGELSRQVNDLVEAVVQLRMFVEAAIDFPEDEIDFLSDGRVAGELIEILARLDEVRACARQGTLLREGMTLVIAGRPNVGKSSLLNRLAGYDAAIVTDIPGTTRDVLREHIQIDGMPLHIIDTAGLRDTLDPVELEGVRRAMAEIERADRVLLVVDDNEGLGADEHDLLKRLPAGLALTIVRNKIDLSGARPGESRDGATPAVRVSAITGDGIDALRTHLKHSIGFAGAEAGSFTARRRHLDALDRARNHLSTGSTRLNEDKAGELLAEELRLAQVALSEITGSFTTEDLLDRIFSSFCIGK